MKISKVTASGSPVGVKNVQSVVVKKGYSPFIQDGTWWQYDESMKGYIDTGVPAQGPAGGQGPPGERGLTGATGAQGERGETGPQGEQGVPGAKGDKGEQGAQGIQGERGEKGNPGEKGDKGEPGAKGEQGPVGPPGEKGETGPKGDTGAVGPQGPKGDSGDKGEIGPQGIPGNNGVSPILTISTISGGHRITITDADGSKSFDVKDGTNGKDAAITKAAIVSALGYTPYDPNKTKLDASMLIGGINSIVNNANALSINPAINGEGFAIERGGKVKISVDGYEFEVDENAAKKLFDGSSKTYINFCQPVTFATSNFVNWNSTKTYPVGAYVKYFVNGGTTGKYYWYKSLVENTNVVPLNDETGTWEFASVDAGNYYASIDFRNSLITLEIEFPDSIRYENGLSLYWRAFGQNAKYIKVEKYDDSGWLLVEENNNVPGQHMVNTFYLGKVGGTTVQQKIIRITFTPAASSWCALCQVAVTGLVGGIEGVLLSRGGGTMFGGINPYTSNVVTLGNSSLKWANIYTSKFTLGNTSLTEGQLQALLKLVT